MAADHPQPPKPAQRPASTPLPPPSQTHVFVKKGADAGTVEKRVK